MKDFNNTNTTTFDKGVSITPKAYDYATDFSEVSNAGGKAVIRNIASPTGVEADFTFQVQELTKGFYKNHPFKAQVSDPTAQGKSIFIKLDKTSDNEATGLDKKVTGESIWICYRSEASNWSNDQFELALQELLGALYDATGNSRVPALLKGALVPKGC